MSTSHSSASHLHFSILGQSVDVECSDPALTEALQNNYAAFLSGTDDSVPALFYRIERPNGKSAGIGIVREGTAPLSADSIGECLYLLEKDMTIELQKQLSYLYFMHAAVLGHRDRAIVVTAPSGTGKSTTAWALLHHGCDYLSDELAPINLADLSVSGYPRALGLKNTPPVYPLPDHYLDTGNSLHIPVSSMPGNCQQRATPIAALVILEYCPELAAAVIEPASRSMAAMHVYANTLNALAHENKGLEGAVSLVTRLPCFHLKSTPDLAGTCKALLNSLE